MAAEKPNTGVIIAVIGAVATIFTACITGAFGIIQLTLDKNADPTATPGAVSELALATAADASALSLSQATATKLAPEVRPTPSPQPGLLFASQIDPDGKAIDPGNTFQASVTEIYAVFPGGKAPPGTAIGVDNPEEGAYYAFLKIDDSSDLASIGWRWVYQGSTVNEYETEPVGGAVVWLSTYSYVEGGIFNGDPLGPGKYTVIVTLAGNPFLSAELAIQP
jgi:hypothetical protein